MEKASISTSKEYLDKPILSLALRIQCLSLSLTPIRREVRLNKKKNVKSGMFAKDSNRVQKPQLWPNNNLEPHFFPKHLKFNEITFEHLVSGEITFIQQTKS